MVSILTEPAYSNSMWCQLLLSSLTARLRQKRIPFCKVSETLPRDSDGVFVIASDYEWIRHMLGQMNSAGIKPILICNQAQAMRDRFYSCVCSDISGSMKYLINELKATGRTRVALYGVNTSSVSDIGRVDGLFAFKDDSFDFMRVFVNNGSLKGCFDEFYPLRSSFDAVVCSNDFAAVSLIKRLRELSPQTLDTLKILCCAQTAISDFYTGTITSINMNYEQYGKAAVYIYESIKTHPYISGMTVTVSWNIEANMQMPSRQVKLESFKGDDGFYADNEIYEMIRIERVLGHSSETDTKIISALMDGLTLEETARRCFLTEGGVKYRIKRILGECQITDKAELISLVTRYLPGYGADIK